jgi:hypothetical protein
MQEDRDADIDLDAARDDSSSPDAAVRAMRPTHCTLHHAIMISFQTQKRGP